MAIYSETVTAAKPSGYILPSESGIHYYKHPMPKTVWAPMPKTAWETTFAASMRNDRAPEPESKMSSKIKAGDWVRVLRNTCSAMSPTNEGMTIMPYEGFKVCKVESRGRHEEVSAVYTSFRNSNVIPLRDVELIEGCICQRPVLRALGCRCGYQDMVDAQAKPKQD